MLSTSLKGFIFLMTFCTVTIAQMPDDDFGYNDWPGKNGAVKHRIEVPVTPFLGYELELTPTFNDSTIWLQMPVSKDDTVKLGRLVMQLYPTIEKAQLGLRDYLYTFQSTIKPPRLKEEEFPNGDVAFGWEKEGVYRVYFCDNNLMIIIEAPDLVARELAAKVDSIIQAAPNWSAGDAQPAFIISEQFIQAFFAMTP
ncbi:MAG: hypothetical protein A2W23_01890 [Planctomycetes bacterium RBG_16_43_13]|nr:MAG: hypothetical protein A2W23_01890 [Planctomycetes bacterium RBG_16_43_13]